MPRSRVAAALLMAAAALAVVTLVLDHESGAFVREDTDDLNKITQETVTQYGIMQEAQEAARAKDEHSEAYKGAEDECRTIRRDAALSCGSAYCSAGAECGEPCPTHLFEQEPFQVVPLNDNHGPSFHVVHEVSYKESHSKEVRDKELKTKELGVKEKKAKQTVWSQAVEKELTAKRKAAGEAAVKENAAKDASANELGAKIRQVEDKEAAMKTDANTTCVEQGLKMVKTCEESQVKEGQEKVREMGVKAQKARIEKFEREQKQQELLAAMERHQKMPSNHSNVSNATYSAAVDAAEQTAATYAALEADLTRDQEDVTEHNLAIGSAEAELQPLEDGAVLTPPPSPPAPVISSYGQTADSCISLDSLTCETTLGCHLDITSDSCVMGTQDEFHTSDASSEAAPSAAPAELSAASDIVPAVPEEAPYDIANIPDVTTASDPSTANILDTDYDGSDDAVSRRLLADSKSAAHYDDPHAYSTPDMAYQETDEHMEGLASGSAKAGITAELDKVKASQEALTAVEGNVTHTNQSQQHDVTLADLYDEEATLMLEGLQNETDAMQEAAKLADDGYTPESMANCSLEQVHSVANCLQNATSAMQSLQQEWMDDAKQQAESWRKQAEDDASKLSSLSDEAKDAAEKLQAVQDASNASVVDIAAADNVTMDPGENFVYPDSKVYLGSLRDNVALGDETKACKSPRAKAYKACETTLDEAYGKCTGIFKGARL